MQSAILATFWNGPGWLCLVSEAIRNLRNIFVLGSYYSQERLEGKTREGPFFKVQSGKITV